MEIVVPVISKVGEYLVEPTINQVRYSLCFNSLIEDLNRAETALELVQDRIKLEVERAKNNTETIEKDVEKWLSETSDTLAQVQQLKHDIQENKSFLKGWCPNWCWRYRLSKKVAKKTSRMLELQESGKFERVAHRTTLPGIEFFSPKDFEPFQSSKSAFDSIIEALKNNNIHLVGLYGMGGVGKTTLAKVIGNEVKKEKIFDEVVMVAVSQSPNFKNIQADLAESLSLKLEEETEEARAKRLYLRFTETSKKVLVILDDVWEKFDLKSKLGLPFGKENKSCKILLTTRKQQVCSTMRCQSRIPLNLLNEDEGLALLKKQAGIDVDSLTFNALVIEVASECKGLPLALVTVGSALKEKGVDEWKLVSHKLKKSKLVEIYNDIDVDVDVYACLKLSYDYLKDEKTKLCFLLCSLFPEDYEIPLEHLFRYGMGLGMYTDVVLIEEARTQFCVMVNNLKASCLLLDANKEECVKMHDMVRDVALWIASQGKNVFMVKAGMGLTEWPKVGSLESYTAISLVGNDIEVLPNNLFCPKLQILLMEGESSQPKVSDEFFKEMKELEVLNLHFWDLSFSSLQFLTNLKTLELIYCNLRDISSLGKLSRIEILSFKGSYLDELPREVGELCKLRLLDLDGCRQLKRIPPSVISRCSQLEELYVIDSFIDWEVEETSAEKNNASLFELNSLCRLARLHLGIYSKFLPKDFDFSKLQRYVICVNTSSYDEPYQRALKISAIGATSLVTFQALYQNLEYLHLRNIEGLQEVFQLEGLCHTGEEKHVAPPSLTKLSLDNLPQLTCIWKGPTQYLILQSLKYVSINSCMNMEYIFPISIARSLVKLEGLSISSVDQLKQVFYVDDGREEVIVASDGKNSVSPKLKKLTLRKLVNLVGFYPPNYHSTWPVLEELIIDDCSNWGTSFVTEVNMQDLSKNLRVLEVGGCNQQFYDDILACWSHDFTSLEEVRIKNCEIEVVFELERRLTATNGQPRQLSLPNLKTLKLISMKELQSLYTVPAHILGLQNLTLLDFTDCSKLRSILSPTLAQSLLQLEKLQVWNCGELEQIIVEDDEEDHVQHSLFPNLRKIDVRRCSKLKHVFPIIIARDLQQLKEIYLDDNSQLVEVFGHKDGADVMDDKEIVFSQLEELTLAALPSFTNICPAGYHCILKLETLRMQHFHENDPVWAAILICFRDVKQLHIEYCDVRHIFSRALAQSLLQLERLYVEECGELEEIIVENDEEDHLQPLPFPNLSNISVRRCNKLKRVFPIIIARDLQKLRGMDVQNNSQLEEVFGHRVRDGADVMDDKPIVFPQLQVLFLETLPSLTNFCPVGYHFIFPSLGKDDGRLFVLRCGKIATRFSLDEKGSVHAEGKPPKDDQDPPPTADICCYNSKDLREQLPPYMETLNEEQKEIE